MTASIAPSPPVADVRRMVVLRGGGIGDLVFTLPALASLRAAYPTAHLELLCGPSQADLLSTGTVVDRVVVLPPPAIAFLEGRTPSDDPALDEVVDRLRSEGPIELAVQLHGGGARSNILVGRLGGVTVGCRAQDAPPLDRSLPYIYYQPEVVRALEVAALAGAPPVGFIPTLDVPGPARLDAGVVLRDISGPFVVVHPMAGDPRRRWPLASYVEVLSDLLSDGWDVVVIGGRDDGETTARLAGAVRRIHGARVHDLGGRLSLRGLVGVLERSALVIGNDSGPLHVAAAVGAPTVGVYWFGNVINAAPFTRSRHRLAISWRRDCPVCGTDCLVDACSHDASFVADVPTAEVLAAARELLMGARELLAAEAGFEMTVKQGWVADRRDSPETARTLG